ncbi:ribosomal protein L32 [Paenibacillus sp. W4I10]|uniref:hypothetical protein n=1 Tax=Paenibacillus sp. W4I10 TaxID=3042298 RepID=UPI00278589FF|nr:hypothetical protein [Paenibacillus sp. W4I10]MDQ0719717.1 ribosomal protein L32 [Paenibacillus sp. W4I10]
MIHNISEIFGMVFFAGLILALFVLGLMGIAGMFLNIYRRLKGLKTKKMEPCRSCGHSISSSAIICPNCGEHYGRRSGFANSIIGCFIVGFVCIGIGFYALSEFLETFETFSFK